MTHHAISPTFAVFLLASLVLALTPWPAVIYLLTRTLTQGRRVGLASIGGVALGNFGNACIASLGLAALLAISALAFTAVKLAGAAYLVYLGVRELRAGRRARAEPPRPPSPDTTVRDHVFRDGFLVALLNPKTAIFFGAFLPQFVDPHGSTLGQTLLVGAGFVSIAACTDTMYVLAADRLGPRIARLGARPGVARYVAGFSFIALGLFVAYGDSRSTR